MTSVDSQRMALMAPQGTGELLSSSDSLPYDFDDTDPEKACDVLPVIEALRRLEIVRSPTPSPEKEAAFEEGALQEKETKPKRPLRNRLALLRGSPYQLSSSHHEENVPKTKSLPDFRGTSANQHMM